MSPFEPKHSRESGLWSFFTSDNEVFCRVEFPGRFEEQLARANQVANALNANVQARKSGAESPAIGPHQPSDDAAVQE